MSGSDGHWTFGDRCHLRFPGGGGPVPDLPHAFVTGEGSATVADDLGNLLFHTDGTNLYGPPPANAAVNPPDQPLGGTSSSCHAAIIVPPAGGGSLYHVFAVGDWDPPQHNIGPVRYTGVAVAPALAIAAPTAPLAFGPQRAAEKLAAVSHEDCCRYWVVSLDLDPSGSGRLFAMLIESDEGPSAAATVSQPYPFPNPARGYAVKFSPDGSLIAISSMTGVDILEFDRATGGFAPHSQVVGGLAGRDAIYGVEFSPNGRHLYLSGHRSGSVWRHDIAAAGSPPARLSAAGRIDRWAGNAKWSRPFRVGALQLGPNGRIYGAKYKK